MSCCQGHHGQRHHHESHPRHHGNHHRHRRSHRGGCQCGNHSEGCRCDNHGERYRCREHHGSADCYCGSGKEHKAGRFHRRYYTREEKTTELEGYLEDLQAEIQTVEERLADLKDET